MPNLSKIAFERFLKANNNNRALTDQLHQVILVGHHNKVSQDEKDAYFDKVTERIEQQLDLMLTNKNTVDQVRTLI